MKDLTGKEIVLHVTGEVIESDFPVFEEKAIVVLGNINTELKTDQDFAEAKQDVKDCKEVEGYLKSKKDDVITSMRAVSSLIKSIGSLESKFANTRLMLDKKVKSEEAVRKDEIIDDGIKSINTHLATTQVQHAFSVDVGAVKNAIKNKRLLEKMEEAVSEVVVSQKESIDQLNALYLENFATIQATEKDCPGLFPDIKTLAVSPKEVVEAQVDSRVNKFKFDQQEKLRKEQEIAELKAKKEREKIAEEAQSKQNDNPPPSFNTEPPVFHEPPSFDDQPTIDVAPTEETLIIRVISSMKQEVAESLNNIDGIVWVSEGQS